jgi:hypothetical protein
MKNREARRKKQKEEEKLERNQNALTKDLKQMSGN